MAQITTVRIPRTLYFVRMDADTNLLPEVLQVDFTLQIGKGRLDASVRVPSGPTTLVQLLPAVKELSSNIVGAIEQTVREEGFVISCKAGCGACCRQLVPISLFEAEDLGNWVRSLPEEQQAALAARFDAAVLALKASGMLERLDFGKTPEPGTRAAVDLALDYLHLGVPCPFLVEESCGIHPIRPVVCREYLVTSPAEFCANPTIETVRPVPMPVKLSRAMMSLAKGLTEEGRGWIPLVFLFSWIRSGLSVASAVQLQGPDVLRMVMEAVQTQPEDEASPVSGTPAQT